MQLRSQSQACRVPDGKRSVRRSPRIARDEAAEEPRRRRGVDASPRSQAAECWIGPTTALLQQSVPANSRGAAQGCFTALTLVGGLAPLAVGAAVDRGAAPDLTAAVIAAVAGAYVAAAGLFLVAAGLVEDGVKGE